MNALRSALWSVLFLMGFCSLLPNQLGAQSFQFTQIQQLTNQDIVLNLSAPTGQAYRIESADSLDVWQPLITFPTNNATSLSHTDGAAPYLTERFYRALELAQPSVLSGDHLATTNGDVILHPHQHAAIILGWNGQYIYVDPKNDVLSYAGQPRGGLVLITHSHSDHFNTTTIEAVRSNNATILCPQAVYTALTATQKVNATVLTNHVSNFLFACGKNFSCLAC